jgi:hypothetical protein
MDEWDTGPFCKHWGSPGDCDICKAEQKLVELLESGEQYEPAELRALVDEVLGTCSVHDFCDGCDTCVVCQKKWHP